MSKRLNKLMKERLIGNDLADWAKEMVEGSDRSIAILGATAIEAELRDMLLEWMLIDEAQQVAKLTGIGGPLSGFYAVSLLADALGFLSDDEFLVVDSIRKVRNVFAHTARPVSFATPEIEDECKVIRTWWDANGDVAVTTSKDAYALSCSAIFLRLAELRLRVTKENLESIRHVAGKLLAAKERTTKKKG